MVPGVDRSHLNAPFPLAKLVAEGYKFCFFKATNALSVPETKFFNASWQEAKAIKNFIRGAYHFFDPRFDGIAQANNYLSRKIDFKAVGCLCPWVDVEDLIVFGANGKQDDAATAAANKWVAVNWQLALQRLHDFLNRVDQATGLKCGIYTYNNYPREIFHGAGFPDRPMWLSSLQATCPVRYDTGKLPEFWQDTYTENHTDMDGNFFTGTQEQLNASANIAA